MYFALKHVSPNDDLGRRQGQLQEGLRGGGFKLAPLDQKFCATPKICKKLVCSSKTVDSGAVFPKTALESTVLGLQTSFLHIFGVTQNF